MTDLTDLHKLLVFAEPVVFGRQLPDEPEQIEHQLGLLVEKLRPIGNEPSASILAQALLLAVSYRINGKDETSRTWAQIAGSVVPLVEKAKAAKLAAGGQRA